MTTAKIAFKTLGCRLNQFETDALASEFTSAGYNIVDFREKADVYIVNSCTVTGQSDSKSRKMMHNALQVEGDPVVVVTGCMVNNHKDYPFRYPGVTYFIENEQKSSIFSLVDAHLKGEIIDKATLPRDVFAYKTAETTFHTRSMIKVQDGCDNFCTFCIIPMVRGRAVSRPVKDVINNIQEVLDLGYREVVLTGVNIGRYKYEYTDFTGLVSQILDLPGDFRVRITSIEPDGFGEGFYELFRHPRLAPHLHLCLQSGSDKTLLRMRRMYSVREFVEVTEKIRLIRDDFNFTTDILVGFPGETTDDFEETCRIAREIGFSHIHTFKYSSRQGTRAARMPEQVNEEEKSRRSAIIRAISLENKKQYYISFKGKMQRLLTEDVRNHQVKGYGEHYIPVRLSAQGLERNVFVDVRLGEYVPADEPYMIASIIP